MQKIEFKIEGRDDPFCFELNDMEFIKMLSKSHPNIHKIVCGALYKKFLHNFELYLGREANIDEITCCERVR